MEREPIEVTRQDRIYCLKASSDYHSEVCEECKFYPNCDHMTQDDMTELTIKDLENLDKIRAEIDEEADYAYADFDRYKEDILHAESDELPDDDFRYGLRRAIEIIDKYKAESEDEE